MPAYSPLDREVKFVKGVGPRRAELLERMGVRTARDLLFHTPRRYEDASSLSPAGALATGQDATIIGRVVSKQVLPTRKGLRIFQAVLQDATGYCECAWPGQPFLDRIIEKGDLLLVRGPVRFFHGQQLHPREYTVLGNAGDGAAAGAEGLVFPIYPATEGLSHRQIRQIITGALDELLTAVTAEDAVPEHLRRAAGLPPLVDALRALHQPQSLAEAEAGRRRLALEELFYLQLIHARAHLDATRARPGVAMPARGTLVNAAYRSLPFALTGAQVRALREISADMASPHRMNRLLQGDVGSGKTVVALLAALRAIENGFQAAFMAPTEILAEQHVRTLTGLLERTGVQVELLTGRLSARARRPVLDRLASGEVHLVVGTHALIQESVRFASLGLAIIDEQHRFGVRQRIALAEQGDSPDVLVMSATPIPRSLALTLYGDLDISVLDERPPGRKRVRTGIRSPGEREAIHEFVRREVAAGRQAYFVLPLVEESETLELSSATEEFERLRTEIFPELRVGLLHGQMGGEERERVMRSFAAGEVDVLVATTVIEVGIDVPNATIMVVEHAERFGLSQLHQLRGRVGRGAEESYCVLVSPAGEASERLRVLARTEDGFEIAEEDLRLRGQGDLFGARQSGLPEFRWARLETDLDLLTMARDAARILIDQDPSLERHASILAGLERGYADRVGMFSMG
jgi:ATP-dependent DNA helicase RecG